MLKNVVDDPSLRGKRHVFRDRLHAGTLLAEKLEEYRGKEAFVLAIPAGGVPVAHAVADRLGLPFEVIVVRKAQIPWEPEAGFGAVSWLGDVMLNEALVRGLGLSDDGIAACIEATKKEVQRRLERFRGGRPYPSLKGKDVIIVDDGLASGYTMLVAASSVKKSSPSRLIVAVPTASASALHLISPNVDEVLCLNLREEALYAVADAYQNWQDLKDEEVLKYIK